uniref:Protein kinase domain-containing protein n=1 Tax=Oryza punctata TaxID=4537 RepID=A0A0E0MIZ6_ORYPU
MFFLWYKKYHGVLPWQKESRSAAKIESFMRKEGTSHPKRYSYSEVRRITRSFAHKLGQGGFGAVYKGVLPDGQEVAVKMLEDTKGDDEGFLNEVTEIGKTSHVNIVTLLGFCLHGSKRALLYEYMSNGSLEKYSVGNNPSEGKKNLSWARLFDIVVGTTRGLEYLHNGCSTSIIHFNIKPPNILLDQDFCPKKNNDVGSSSNYFPDWLYNNVGQFCCASSRISRDSMEIVEINSDTELVKKMVLVGLWCIMFNHVDRPSMSRVLQMLESNTEDLQLPPRMPLSQISVIDSSSPGSCETPMSGPLLASIADT